MRDYVAELMAEVKAKNPAEPEFHQAVQEVVDSLMIVLEQPSRISARENSPTHHRTGTGHHVSRSVAGRSGQSPR